MPDGDAVRSQELSFARMWSNYIDMKQRAEAAEERIAALQADIQALSDGPGLEDYLRLAKQLEAHHQGDYELTVDPLWGVQCPTCASAAPDREDADA